ncbi:GNAT family N-acetyltransferase [bacterium]|nr:GNAT family N-acetyltransferase [bacterium]
MQKIVTAQSRDLPALSKCMRRSEIPFESSFLSEEKLNEAIEEGRVSVLKDGASLYGFASYYDFPLEAIFPNSAKKQNDFLESIGYRGEPLLLLEAVYCDPMRQRKGYASLLLSSLFSKKKDATFLTVLPMDRMEFLPFFKEARFVPYGFLESGALLLVRKKKKEGLCSDPSF